MGVRNVGLVVRYWSHLPHAAWRLLVVMAYHADDVGRECWLGADELAALMGGTRPDEHDGPGQCALRARQRELVKAGAIVKAERGRRGRQATWRLNVEPDLATIGCGQPVEESVDNSTVGES